MRLSLEQQPQQQWHSLSTEEAFEQLQSCPEGISSSEAERRLERFGPNSLPTEGEVSALDILLDQVRSPLIYVLFAAAVASALLESFIDVGVILAVIVLNTIVGFIQEYQAEQSLRALAKIISPHARVIRDGVAQEINASEVVPGDVILLESGVRVPADARVFSEYELNIDESMLTGESLPVLKTSETLEGTRLTMADQRNMVFMGTLALRGRGTALAVRTGANTALGEISTEVQQAGRGDTPLQIKLRELTRYIVIGVIALSVIVVLFGLFRGETFGNILLTAVSMAVATVPEGLPVTVTVALAVGVNRMAQRHAIIRKLPAVETLGSATVIGSDKTGTLTKNEMTVTKIYTAGRVYHIGGIGYAPEGQITLDFNGTPDGTPINITDDQDLRMTLLAGVLANESSLYQEDGRYRPDGDPTEVALIVAAEKAGLSHERESMAYPLIDELPFESDRQYMASLREVNGKHLVFVKGAPERIISMSTQTSDGAPLDRHAAARVVDEFGDEGLRVLAMGYREMPKDAREIECESVECSLTFLGLQGLLDPPRPEAIEAIANAQRAGIKVVMITGDQKITAQAIARRMGIDGQEHVTPRALTGSQIEELSDDELYDEVENVAVYARATPLHKLRIVEQLQKQGEVVAVTGDGVNDAPALKRADIGISMGISGTDVAKEAADMVLTDDNFATIFAAVEEGRVVYDNIRKVILFLIPTGVSIVLVVLSSLILGLPLPFLPAQAIWINLVTNGTQDVAMAFEPPEAGVARRAPRDPKEPVLTNPMLIHTLLVGIVLAMGTLGLFILSLNNGASLDQARTIALTTMVLFQNFHIFNSRSFTRPFFTMNPLTNRFLFISVVAALGLHILAVYFAPLQFVLRTTPLDLQSWLLIIAVASSVLWVVEIEKALRRWRGGEPKPRH